ncbi:MAG: NAD(P)-dependent oxidoreductase [Rhizobiaceae bacterium]|nr:NAD(P)-dependent oxidoreductase [Rhizobiaceae bacterium]
MDDQQISYRLQGNQLMRVGMIGLGAMGLQMARHMKNKGAAVLGYDVFPEASAKALQDGIECRASIAELGRDVDVAIVMVQNDAQVEAVGSELISVMPSGSVICIASSTAPDTCRQLAARALERGIGILDTPVVHGQEGANNGTLTVLAGGEEKWLARARPALEAFSKHIILVGGVGHGQIAKSVNNMLLWACICANYEALTLARQLGADVPRLIEAMGYSSGANAPLARWGRATGKWAEKDMDVALDLAQQARLSLPLHGLVDQLIKTIDQPKMKSLLEPLDL